MWGGGGEGGWGAMVRKTYCTGSWKLTTILLYNPLKSPVGAHVHKTTHELLMDTVLCVMLLMRANPRLGQMGGGWALEISTFLGPKWHLPEGLMPFQKALPTHTCPRIGFACIKSFMYGGL